MFTVLERISWPGHPEKPNEDICGVSGDWAWVIDTSIFPGTKPVMDEKSDAAWLARFADERLSNLASQAEDGVALLRHVMEEARTAYRAVAPMERHEDFVTWPLGAMTLVHRKGKVLDAWTFGDTTAYVRQPDGSVQVLGDAPGLREAEAAKAAELMRQAGSRPTAILDEPVFLAWLGERRERQRKSGVPAALLSLNPDAAGRLRHETASCEEGTVILLASDGFSALVDLYRAMDARALVEAAQADGLEKLAKLAREIEAERDPDGRLFPRFKASDDTTALLLRA
ncbi:protein phosphatase 2C domain-containing protein [Microvirga mediterraneensis]|uniref:Protein phosphatase 2C domain-containing protein n=1 Tax=Microvirga mediterraneensis TaxID=2754695 RepID=A0A838BMA6_9HYPH|nr:protein phosphatase 2C domain-containing protein [Microvirga mediterraneensis]MBA1156804.1 protein phosphatase 2C domain-containing protein [Microvirga mediterraneensis]